MADAVLADRSEQHPGKPAMSAAAHHEQAGTLGRVEQHTGRTPFHDTLPHRDTAARRDAVHASLSVFAARSASHVSAISHA